MDWQSCLGHEALQRCAYRATSQDKQAPMNYGGGDRCYPRPCATATETRASWSCGRGARATAAATRKVVAVSGGAAGVGLMSWCQGSASRIIPSQRLGRRTGGGSGVVVVRAAAGRARWRWCSLRLCCGFRGFELGAMRVYPHVAVSQASTTGWRAWMLCMAPGTAEWKTVTG